MRSKRTDKVARFIMLVLTLLGLCLLLSLSIPWIAAPVSAQEPGIITFPDPALEVAVREGLDKSEGDITTEDMSSLTGLDASGWGIQDLTGLEYATGLEWLYLDNNQLSDISLLSSLTSLQELVLDNNQISDISPLADLTSLEFLHLEENQISDISPLVDNQGLGEGDEVYLSDNPLSEESVNTHIPALQQRGIQVLFEV
jgi:internalin A